MALGDLTAAPSDCYEVRGDRDQLFTAAQGRKARDNNAHKLKEKVQPGYKGRTHTRTIRKSNRLPRQVVQALSLVVFMLDKPLSSLGWPQSWVCCEQKAGSWPPELPSSLWFSAFPQSFLWGDLRHPELCLLHRVLRVTSGCPRSCYFISLRATNFSLGITYNWQCFPWNVPNSTS